MLPFIDAHAAEAAAPPAAVWDGLLRSLEGAFGTRPAAAYGALVGCRPRGAAGRFGEEGSSVPGFAVVRAEPPAVLVLRGRHRFSRYELAFAIEDLGGGRSRLRAETRAAFPGPHGLAYRTLVIGSGGHAVGVRRLLAGVARRVAVQPRT